MATLNSVRVEAHSAPDTGEIPFARHLVKVVRLLLLIYMAVLVFRNLLLPHVGAVAKAPGIVWPSLAILVVLFIIPWERLTRWPGLFLLCLLAIPSVRAISSVYSTWIAGFSAWWPIALGSMTMAIVVSTAELLTAPRHAGRPWRLSALQWALVALFAGEMAAICWATWNGPGSSPREALLMNRTLWSSTLVAIVTVVLLKAYRHGVEPVRWQQAVAWCLVGFTLAHMLVSIPLDDWFASESALNPGADFSLTFWIWSGLAGVGVIPRTRRHFFSVITVVLLLWVTSTAFTEPQLASVGLPFLAILCALIAGGQRKLLSALAWGVVLVVFAVAPDTKTTQVLLFGLAGTGVLGLIMYLVHGLHKLTSLSASGTRSADDAGHSPPGWFVPAALAAGLVPGYLFWSIGLPVGNPAMRIQLSLLILLLFGGASYAGMRAWAASRLRAGQRKTISQLQGVLDASQTVYSLWRADGGFVWCNRANIEMMGGSPASVAGVSLFKLPMYRACISEQATDSLLRDGQMQQVNYQGPSLFGVELDVSASYSRIMIEGEFLVLAEYMDLRAEHALEREAQQRLQGVLEASDTAFSLWRADGSFVWCNQANLALIGDTLEQHRSRNLFQHPGLIAHDPARLISQVIVEGVKQQVEFQNTMPSGARLDLRATLSRVMLGDTVHVLLQKIDLTDMLNARRAAESARVAAQASELANV